ncbi:hypothetical protein [Mucilaginibacter flavus]|nr:hypothetical protein [Mucilaginibacter flavus]MDN3584132.1 hypothetical protein [Mucilaginibacter flavus]
MVSTFDAEFSNGLLVKRLIIAKPMPPSPPPLYLISIMSPLVLLIEVV